MGLGPRARLKPYNCHSDYIPTQPVMTHRKTSQFRLIRGVAEAENWGILYHDQGIGHDSHTFIQKLRGEVLEVFYRSSKPVRAYWNGDEVDVHQIVDILTGLDVPKVRRRRK